MSIVKTILLWVLCAFLALTAVAFLPGIAGFLALLAAILVLPVKKWQRLLERFVKGWLKAAVVTVLAVATFATAPAAPPADNTELLSASRDALAVATTTTPATTTTQVTTTTPATTTTQATTTTPATTTTQATTTTPATTTTQAMTTTPVTTTTQATTTTPATTTTQATTTTAATTTTKATAVTTTNEKTNYIANKNPKSMKFHKTSCDSVDTMNESNKLYFTGTRDDLIAKGYTPCKNCNP